MRGGGGHEGKRGGGVCDCVCFRAKIITAINITGFGWGTWWITN